MEIVRHIEAQPLAFAGSIVTLGNFDGIHLGHQALVRHTVEQARADGCPSVVLTFEPHPLKVLAPERAPKLILTHKDKMQLLQTLGVDVVVVQGFDSVFAALEAEQFVDRFLVHRLRAKRVWVGRDLRFGRGRKGGIEDLTRWGAEKGFTVGVVEPILVDGVRVSSSRIRQLVEEGRLDEVVPLLGRYHFVSGRVVSGNRRGRELGFPTANISSRTEVLPRDGIYATLLECREKKLQSVSSVGVNPTFGDGPRTVESFILNFNDDIYGEPIKLFFLRRLRDEQKFPSVERLLEQIRDDVARAKAIFDDLRISGAQ
jgi:riboflavin kinase/FMN adenylyltransferase